MWAAGTLALVATAAFAVADSTPPDLTSRAMEPETRTALLVRLDAAGRWRPADATVALQQGYVESLRPGPLSRATVEALRKSYVIEPLGPDVSAWRLRFIFDHWSAMPQDLRDRALTELSAAFPRHGWAMRDLSQSITDPAGRMVARLMFDRLRAAQPGQSSDAVQNAR